MSPKRIFITGGNRGIGLSIAERCLATDENAFVIIGSRSLDKGAHAKENLVKKNAGYEKRLDYIQIDVTQKSSVDEAVKTYESRYAEPLYALVNNAAVGFDFSWLGYGRKENVGAETCECNYFGVARCFEAFKPSLMRNHKEKGVKGRLVNMSSDAAERYLKDADMRIRELLFGETSIEELDEVVRTFVKKYDGCPHEEKGKNDEDGYFLKAYHFSKAAVSAYTFKLAKLYPDSLLINCCHPGFVETEMTNTYPHLENLGTPEDASKCPTFLCLSDEVQQTGMYFLADCKAGKLF